MATARPRPAHRCAHLGAQERVAGDPARDDDRRHGLPLRRLERPLHEHVHDGALERGRDVADLGRDGLQAPRSPSGARPCPASLLLDRPPLGAVRIVGGCGCRALDGEARRARVAQEGRLQAAEGEIERAVRHPRPRERHGLRVSLLREPVDDGPAGVAEPEQARRLVERLARGVVAGAGDQPVDPFHRAEVERGVPARDYEGEGGERQLRRFEECGPDVPFEMVHGDERLAGRPGERLREGDADQERADQPGARRDGDGVDPRAGRLPPRRAPGRRSARCSRGGGARRARARRRRTRGGSPSGTTPRSRGRGGDPRRRRSPCRRRTSRSRGPS